MLLNFTSAQASAAETDLTPVRPPQADFAYAAMRPLAVSGAGAFTCDGTLTGSAAGYKAAALALPRVKHFSAAPQQISAAQQQTTRIYPVTPGGLGPHPAREPDPV